MDDNAREIPSDEAMWLRQSLGLEEHDVLPPKLVEKFWELKRIFDRTGTRLTAGWIGLLCFQLGFGKQLTKKEQKEPDVVDMYRKKQVKIEDPVEVLYRDKWMDGVLKGINANDELTVQPVGEPDERKFTRDQVRQVRAAAA